MQVIEAYETRSSTLLNVNQHYTKIFALFLAHLSNYLYLCTIKTCSTKNSIIMQDPNYDGAAKSVNRKPYTVNSLGCTQLASVTSPSFSHRMPGRNSVACSLNIPICVPLRRSAAAPSSPPKSTKFTKCSASLKHPILGYFRPSDFGLRKLRLSLAQTSTFHKGNPDFPLSAIYQSINLSKTVPDLSK